MFKNKLSTLFFDLECTPCLAHVWSTGKQYVGAEQILEPTRIICISYKWEGEKKIYTLYWDAKQCDKSMLKDFTKVLDKADQIVGHNGRNFDVRHINARIAFHNLPKPTLPLVGDTLPALRRALRLPSYKLSYLATYFGLPAKLSTGGINLWLDVWLKKCPKALKKMITYCEGDVRLLERVYHRVLDHVDMKMINKAISIMEYDSCPHCGKKDALIKWGTRFVTPMKKVQVYKCNSCQRTSRGGKNLISGTNDYKR